MNADITHSSILSNFLKNISSKENQIKLFEEKGYLVKLDPENLSQDSRAIANSFVQSIELTEPNINEVPSLYELPYTISLSGYDKSLMTDFLEDLLVYSSDLTINQVLNTIDYENKNLLSGYLFERDLIIEQSANRRLLKIKQLQGEAKMAKTLGISNTINDLINIVKNPSSLENLPEWLIYGEKALLERIKLIEETADFETIYIPGILEIDKKIDIINNKSRPKFKDLKIIEVIQMPFYFYDGINKKIFAILGALVGFIFALFTALIRNEIRLEKKLG